MSNGKLGGSVKNALSQIDQFNHPRDIIEFKPIINWGHNHLESNTHGIKLWNKQTPYQLAYI